jgi:hypothetical protein
MALSDVPFSALVRELSLLRNTPPTPAVDDLVARLSAELDRRVPVGASTSDQARSRGELRAEVQTTIAGVFDAMGPAGRRGGRP